MEQRGFIQSEKGVHITNLPKSSCSKKTYQTGNYKTDYYGCWWECHDEIHNSRFWMIGEYPAKFFDELYTK